MNNSKIIRFFLPVSLYLFFTVSLSSQSADSTSTPDSLNRPTVKYFATELMRSDILTKDTTEKSLEGKAHFKATYAPSGKLQSVEYIPAAWDQGPRKKTHTAAKLKLLYKKWNPRKQELLEGLTKKDARGKSHYSAILDDQERVQDVEYFNRRGRRLWTYHIIWNSAGKTSEYDVEFHIRRPLTIMDEYLFATDLSEMRPGWRAKYRVNNNFNPRVVEVYDTHGDLVYFYNFSYQQNKVVSTYSRADSTLVGSHSIEYKSKGKVSRVIYFNSNGVMKRKVTYEYPPGSEHVIVTRYNSRGEVLERRVVRQ